MTSVPASVLANGDGDLASRARARMSPATRAPYTLAVLVIALMLVALDACGGDSRPTNTAAGGSSAPAVGAAASPGAPAPAVRGGVATPAAPNGAAGSPCYLRELWDECTLLKRLELQGYVPKVDGRDAGTLGKTFHAPYVDVRLGRGRLKAFIYPTIAAATADLARADTVGQSACPPPSNSRYGGALFHSGNIVTLLQAENDNTCVRIGDLIAAGLPKLQPK